MISRDRRGETVIADTNIRVAFFARGRFQRINYTSLIAIFFHSFTSPLPQADRFMNVQLVFYLTLALAWSISCCFSLDSVWICCSLACLSCSSCLRKASSHAFNLSTAELKKQNRRLCLSNNVKPSNSRVTSSLWLFQGPSHCLREKPWGRGWFPGFLFSSRPARERLVRDAPGDEKKRDSGNEVGFLTQQLVKASCR